jgi:hypothetical protein
MILKNVGKEGEGIFRMVIDFNQKIEKTQKKCSIYLLPKLFRYLRKFSKNISEFEDYQNHAKETYTIYKKTQTKIQEARSPLQIYS